MIFVWKLCLFDYLIHKCHFTGILCLKCNFRKNHDFGEVWDKVQWSGLSENKKKTKFQNLEIPPPARLFSPPVKILQKERRKSSREHKFWQIHLATGQIHLAAGQMHLAAVHINLAAGQNRKTKNFIFQKSRRRKNNVAVG